MFPNPRIVQGGSDDRPLYAVYKDLSGGINERVHARDITRNQAVTLDNVDLGTPATLYKRPGSVLIGDDVGSDTPTCLHNFEIQGATDYLLMYEDQRMWAWNGTGNWASISLITLSTASTDVGMINAKLSGVSPDDVVIMQNDQDNAKMIYANLSIADLGSTSGTGTDDIPQTTVMAWYGNRVWALKDEGLYFSSAYPTDYVGAFDTVSDVFRIPVGDERGLVPTRNLGLVCIGQLGIWAIFPSATPAATDRPEPLVVDVGCVSKKGWAIVGDDIYFFAQDGLRALKRTVQDKLQLGADYPVSYVLKDSFDNVSWANISKLSMEYFDNKLFIAVPTGASSFDTWIYYPATNAFSKIKGWTPSCWSKYKISGEERLYHGKTGDGKVYQAWTGTTDEALSSASAGSLVTFVVETRAENFDQPLVWKVGGEIEIEAAAASAADTIIVEARADEGNYEPLGTISLSSSSSPTLPVALPFTLSDESLIREKFHLDPLGRFRSVQVKLTNATNNSDDVKVYNINLVTYPEEYRGE